MLVTFEYSICFGKLHYGEGYVQAELTEEEQERLQLAKESGEEFIYCESVADIYNRVYELADDYATQDLIDEGILDKDLKASDLYPIEVYYPE